MDREDTKCVQNGTRKSSHFVSQNELLVGPLKEPKPFDFLVFRARNGSLRDQVLAPERELERSPKRSQNRVKFGAGIEPVNHSTRHQNNFLLAAGPQNQSFDKIVSINSFLLKFSFGAQASESFIQSNFILSAIVYTFSIPINHNVISYVLYLYNYTGIPRYEL